MYVVNRTIESVLRSRVVNVFKHLLFLGGLLLTLSLSSQLYGAPGIELLNPNPAQGDRMGYAVSIDGDYAVVGTRLDDASGLTNSGSVEIFKRDGSGTWLHHQTLLSPEINAQQHFGHAVGISGDFLVVGEEKNSTNGFRAGAAHLFKRDAMDNDIWKHASTNPYGNARDFAGRSVAIDGFRYVVGILNDDNSGLNAGSAFTAEFDSDGQITVMANLIPLDVAPGDNVGNAVSISGRHAVVGAFRDDDTANGSGSAYVFYRSGGAGWIQIAKLVADDAAAVDQFGFSVSISGNRVAVGSRLSDTALGNQVGAVYVFEGSDTDMNGSLDSWTQVEKLTASDAIAGDRLGTSVAIDDDLLISGAVERDEFGMDAGIVYYFKRNGIGIWEEQDPIFDSETTTRDEFGIGVALDTANGRALVGSWLDNRPQNNSGAAYLFPFEVFAPGDTGPGGGIVFSVNASGTGGLEAAPADQSTIFGAEWCVDYLIDIPGVDNIPDAATPDTHNGAENTAAIVLNCPTGGNAAEIAANYVWPNGQLDGYLPNKEELDLLHDRKDDVGGFVNFPYWSSSETAFGGAWALQFLSGSQFETSKLNTYRVRAVRAF